MTDKKNSGGGAIEVAVWWAMLLIAVLAIPVLAVSVMLAIPGGEAVKAVVFIVTCWSCTWVGMWLVHKSKNTHPPQA